MGSQLDFVRDVQNVVNYLGVYHEVIVASEDCFDDLVFELTMQNIQICFSDLIS